MPCAASRFAATVKPMTFPPQLSSWRRVGLRPTGSGETRYLGPGWDLAKVRGTRFNLGDGIRMALEIGASSAGHWSGCHAVAWDMNSPEFR